MEWFTPALLGLFGGVIGSLIAPWVHWAIEKRRIKTSHQRKSIEDWRSQIEQFDWDYDTFGNSSTYGAMRPHMKEDVINRFEAQRTIHIPPEGGRGSNLKKQWAADEIARIENEWKLL